MKKVKQLEYIVGIDEAGRGPLAGPMTVAAVGFRIVNFTVNFKKSKLNGIKDSKKLTTKKREEWFLNLKGWEAEGLCDVAIVFISSDAIDKHGITKSLRDGVRKLLAKLGFSPQKTKVLLDGTLYAPKEFIYQKTIIKGDEREPLITLAGISAKVTRDKKMIWLAQKFPDYGFEIHKGYGTKAHRDAIKKYGQCPIHRRSFSFH